MSANPADDRAVMDVLRQRSAPAQAPKPDVVMANGNLDRGRSVLWTALRDLGIEHRFRLAVDTAQRMVYAEAIINPTTRVLVATEDEIAAHDFGPAGKRLDYIKNMAVYPA